MERILPHRLSAFEGMKFPVAFHHRSGSGSCASRDHRAHDIMSPSPSASAMPVPSPPRVDGRSYELVSVIAAMHESENGGLYDPSGRFDYRAAPGRGLQQTACNDRMVATPPPMVDDICRSKMLDWCSKVSIVHRLCICHLCSPRPSRRLICSLCRYIYSNCHYHCPPST